MPDFALTPVDNDPFAEESGADWAARLKASPGYDPATDSYRIPEGPSASMPPLPPTRRPIQQIQDITQQAQTERSRFPTPPVEEQIKAIGSAVTANPVFSIAERGASGPPQPPLSDDPAEMDRYLEAQKHYYGGNFMDVLGIAAPQMARPEENAAGIFGSKPMQAYHGSPHDFDEFQTSKIGTGQGAQSYGHGLYFAENPAVAEDYKRTLSPLGLRDRAGNDVPMRVGEQSLLRELNSFDGDHDALIKAYRDSLGGVRYPEYLKLDAQDKINTLERWKAQGATPQRTGKMYQVDIDEDPSKFIDLDVPWHKQPPEIQDIIEKVKGGGIARDWDIPMEAVLSDLGDDVLAKQLREGKISQQQYNDMGSPQGRRAAVASALREEGVPGFKYFDEKSRDRMPDSRIAAEIKFKREGYEFFKNRGAPGDDHSMNLMLSDIARLEEMRDTPQTQNAVVFNDRNIKIRSKLGALGSGDEATPEGSVARAVSGGRSAVANESPKRYTAAQKGGSNGGPSPEEVAAQRAAPRAAGEPGSVGPGDVGGAEANLPTHPGGATAPGYGGARLLEASPQAYHAAVSQAKAEHKFGSSVTLYSPEEYAGMKTFLTEDGKAGYALKDGDEIVSAFNNSPQKRIARDVLKHATDNGGRRLDAFDTVLPKIYGKSGFKATARVPFSDEYRPPDWDYDLYKDFNGGRPDVVHMVYDPGHHAPYYPGDGRMFQDYDEAASFNKSQLGVPTPAPKGWISQRLPKAAGATEDPFTQELIIDADALRNSPVSKSRPNDLPPWQKNVGLTGNYPNFANEPRLNDVESQYQRLKDHVKANLKFIYDNMPKAIQERSKNWYVGASKIADEMAAKYNISKEQAAAVFAALSPQKDWFMNVSLGKRLLDIYHGEQNTPFDSKMLKTAQDIYSADPKLLEKTNAKGQPNDKYNPELYAEQKAKWDAQIARMNGKKLSEMTNAKDKAAWIRAFDETYNSPDHFVISPEGETMGRVFKQPTAKQLKQGQTQGDPWKTAWGSIDEIAKGVDAIESGGNINKISEGMGEKHKVRNFYNNIMNPYSTKGDVTIDTHAVAAAFLRPLSQADTEVLHNFKSGPLSGKRPADWIGGAGGSGITGAQGTYGILADAYRELARELGILPRELQSITWEGVRGLFPESMKQGTQGKGFRDVVNQIWKDDKLTLAQKQEKIKNQAGGFRPPDWHTDK